MTNLIRTILVAAAFGLALALPSPAAAWTNYLTEAEAGTAAMGCTRDAARAVVGPSYPGAGSTWSGAHRTGQVTVWINANHFFLVGAGGQTRLVQYRVQVIEVLFSGYKYCNTIIRTV